MKRDIEITATPGPEVGKLQPLIAVSREMIAAGIDRLNELRGSGDGEVAMSWEDVLREAYVAMEQKRRDRLPEPGQLGGPILGNA